MTIRDWAIFIGVAAICLMSCSEERKREAARLERMMSGDTTAEFDSSSIAAVQDSSSATLPQQDEPDDARETPAAPDAGFDRSTTKQATGGAIVDRVSAEPFAQEMPSDTVPDVNAIPEEAAVRKPAMPRRPMGESYTVQVGSAVTLAEAQALVATLQHDGYQPYIATVTVNDRDHYRIRVGRLPTSEEAMRLKNELAQKYAIEPWIDKISE